MRSLGLAYLLLYFSLTIAPSFAADKSFIISSPDAAYPASRQLRYSFTIENQQKELAHDLDFWTYAPVRQTSSQKVLRIETSQPCDLIEDEIGNLILHFKFSRIPRNGKKMVIIKSFLAISDNCDTLKLRDKDLYLSAEKFVERDHPDIIRLAEKLGNRAPSKWVENIFDWVSSNIKYAGYLAEERGALYALDNKRGDCTEFMDLFVAIARAAGIPARRIAGYVKSADAVAHSGDFHNWAEFYLDGKWHIADPQGKSFKKNQSHYLALTILGKSEKNPLRDEYRFKTSSSDILVSMN